jgi:hypothetical protein
VKRLPCISYDSLKVINTSEVSAVLDQCWLTPQFGFLLSMCAACYILTPTGFSSRNWNGTWRLTLLCSTTRWPRRCDAPTTRTVSPLSKTTSPLASSEMIKREYEKRTYIHLWHDGAVHRCTKWTARDRVLNKLIVTLLGCIFTDLFIREVRSSQKGKTNGEINRRIQNSSVDFVTL